MIPLSLTMISWIYAFAAVAVVVTAGPTSEKRELEEFVPGTDYFQLDDPEFVWVGHGGCETANNNGEVTTEYYCDNDEDGANSASSVYRCRDTCLEQDDCIGFEYDLYSVKCNGNVVCIIYTTSSDDAMTKIERSTPYSVGLQTEDDPNNPYATGIAGCVNITGRDGFGPYSNVQVLNNGSGDCRPEQCIACESPWDESGSGCVAGTYYQCMRWCLLDPRCKGFKWNGTPNMFETCVDMFNVTDSGWCKYYKVPAEVPLEEANGPEWQINGVSIHPGGGMECYARIDVVAKEEEADSSEDSKIDSEPSSSGGNGRSVVVFSLTFGFLLAGAFSVVM